ncbi:MAG TPA: hypothetical protein VJ327_07730 [Patescibacteria group bacterium]|nr:hypothetical protein [Patescibacteria group bacterium]
MFSYDQARDAFTINNELLRGDLKIQGPPTSTRDFFHGVLYYYVLAPGYFLGHGSPTIAAIWLSAVNSVGIFLAYFIALQLLKNRFWAGITSLLIAVSYEQTQYSIYLANTTLATIFVPLIYFGLWLWRNQKKPGSFLTGLALGLSFQANFIFIYHLAVIVFSFLISKVRPSLRQVAVFIGVFLLTTSTMWLSEIKFGFPSRSGPAGLLNRSTYSRLQVSPTTILNTSIHQFKRLVSLNITPTHPSLAIIFFVICYLGFGIFGRKPDWWWLFSVSLVSFAPPLVLGGIGTPYIHAGLGLAVILFFVYFFSQFFSKFPPLVSFFLIPIVFSNLAYISRNNSKGETEFAIQKTMTLRHELDAIDYMYSEAQGKPFTFNSITAPLYINTTWSYLFNWYAKDKYGYFPFWHGRNQIGLQGNNLSRPPQDIHSVFVIIEPSQGLPQDLTDKILDEEKYYSSFNHQKQFGEITVQNRTRRTSE